MSCGFLRALNLLKYASVSFDNIQTDSWASWPFSLFNQSNSVLMCVLYQSSMKFSLEKGFYCSKMYETISPLSHEAECQRQLRVTNQSLIELKSNPHLMTKVHICLCICVCWFVCLMLFISLSQWWFSNLACIRMTCGAFKYLYAQDTTKYHHPKSLGIGPRHLWFFKTSIMIPDVGITKLENQWLW